MPGYPVGVQNGYSGPPNTLGVLGKTTDGTARRGILRGGF